jgi:hypothetical protein
VQGIVEKNRPHATNGGVQPQPTPAPAPSPKAKGSSEEKPGGQSGSQQKPHVR